MLFTKTFALGAIAMATSVVAQSGIAFTSIFRSVNGGQVVNVTYAFGDGSVRPFFLPLIHCPHSTLLLR